MMNRICTTISIAVTMVVAACDNAPRTQLSVDTNNFSIWASNFPTLQINSESMVEMMDQNYYKPWAEIHYQDTNQMPLSPTNRWMYFPTNYEPYVLKATNGYELHFRKDNGKGE